MALTKLNNQSIAALTDFNLSADDLPDGSLLQVVKGSNFDYSLLSTTSTYTNSPLEVTITPKFANSKILVLATGSIRINGSSVSSTVYINRGSYRILNTTSGTAVSNASTYNEIMQIRVNNQSVQEANYPFSASGIDTPNSTAPQTYNFQIYLHPTGGSSIYVTHNYSSSIIAMEIAG